MGCKASRRNGRIVSWGEREGLTNPFVTSLHHDRTDTLWIGTYGGGLFRLQHGKVSSITTRDGLPDDVVFDVLEDDAGRLWLTGTQGLAVVRLADVNARMDGRGGVLSVAQYGRAEGVPGTDGTDGNQPLSWLATRRPPVVRDCRRRGHLRSDRGRRYAGRAGGEHRHGAGEQGASGTVRAGQPARRHATSTSRTARRA